MSEDAHEHEVLIIKRGGGGHHDEHHGGVWKIAFADFMTAMMAFFLVMWLISANDKTKATIAKYFNPIELVDSTPQPTGLNDTKKDDPNVQRKADKADKADKAAQETSAKEKDAKEAKAVDKPAPPSQTAPEGAAPKSADEPPLDDAAQSARHDEMEVISDPYAVIAEVAAKKSAEPPRQSLISSGVQPASGTGAVGLHNGEAFRDPFEPQPIDAASNPFGARPDVPLPPTSTVADAPPVPSATGPAAAAAKVAGAPAAMASVAPAPPVAPPMQGGGTLPQSGAGRQAEAGKGGAPADAGKDGASADAGKGGVSAEPGKGGVSVELGKGGTADDKPLSAPALQSRIAAIVKAPEAGQPAGAPKVEVRQTDEGTLISLTDTADFSMFNSASARPSAKAVALMARIGRLLKAQKGGVTIRGFTDSRPFRSETYDNWRLSTERAHLAQYMLVRGGLDDARIDAVEGFADRHPKDPKDPEGAENRRIEILIRNPAP